MSALLPPATPVLLRGLRQHLDVWRHGDHDERMLGRMGLMLLRDLAVRLSVVNAGRTLDYVVAPAFRKVAVRAPVFVVAPPRSGTTLLYSMLAADPRFVGPRLYESLLPSISVLRATEALGGVVQRVRGGTLAADFDRWELETFTDLDPIHRVRYRELEEDTVLFDRHFMCPSAMRFFPRSHELLPLTILDDQPPAARTAVMEAYYRAVQRILYRSRSPEPTALEPTYLAKNIYSAGRIGSLLERFPDARFIHIVRSPYAVIPSAVRLFLRSNHLGIPADRRPPMPADHPFWRAFADMVIDSYQRLLGWERQIPAAQWLTLRFEALVGDPLATVRQVYEHFGIALPPEAEAPIEAEASRARQYRATDGSSLKLEGCGLSREQVYTQLREVFEAYGLER